MALDPLVSWRVWCLLSSRKGRGSRVLLIFGCPPMTFCLAANASSWAATICTTSTFIYCMAFRCRGKIWGAWLGGCSPETRATGLLGGAWCGSWARSVARLLLASTFLFLGEKPCHQVIHYKIAVCAAFEETVGMEKVLIEAFYFMCRKKPDAAK